MDSSFIGVAGQQQVVHGGTYRDVMVPQKRKWRNNSGSNQRFRKRSKTQQQQQGEKLTVVRAAGVYDPPRLKDLQRQNRLKTRKYFPRRRKSVPSAPFNNSSFLMRVRRSGGLASIVSPATPAFLTTPVFSPAPNYGREGGLVEEVKDLGVNGYGSMAGFIHLRAFDDDDDDDEQPTSTATAANESSRMVIAQPPSSSNSAQSSVQQLDQRLEQRLDRDVSRFEMTYPSSTHGMNNSSQLLEVRLAEQEGHIAYLEDENLTLKERLFLIQQELTELRQRVVQGGGGAYQLGTDMMRFDCFPLLEDWRSPLPEGVHMLFHVIVVASNNAMISLGSSSGKIYLWFIVEDIFTILLVLSNLCTESYISWNS